MAKPRLTLPFRSAEPRGSRHEQQRREQKKQHGRCSLSERKATRSSIGSTAPCKFCLWARSYYGGARASNKDHCGGHVRRLLWAFDGCTCLNYHVDAVPRVHASGERTSKHFPVLPSDLQRCAATSLYRCCRGPTLTDALQKSQALVRKLKVGQSGATLHLAGSQELPTSHSNDLHLVDPRCGVQ